jgi:hypothetical protein
MSSLELGALNLQAGYGNSTIKAKQNGAEQDLWQDGAALSGDIELGYTATKENGNSRSKQGLDLVSAKADTIIGRSQDRYLRTSLNVGPAYHGDITNPHGRIAWQAGATGRLETSDIKVNDATVSGHNFSLAFPLAFGLGTSHIFVQDKVELMATFPGFKIKNEVSGNWRPYANFSNRFVQTVDVIMSHTFESGKMTGDITARNEILFVGLNLGFGYSVKKD